MPLYPFFIWHSIKSGYFFWSSVANPGLDEYGGFFGESKTDILKNIPKEYMPKQIFIQNSISIEELILAVRDEKMQYPLIAKPDIGERGNGVTVIKNEEDWKTYLLIPFVAFVVQEFITFPEEMGVFYVKNPETGIGKVTSITKKKFLTATGDGKVTLGEWVQSNTRARFQENRLKVKFADQWERVLNVNESVLLEPIGNHCLGTEFLSGNHLLGKEVDNVFNEIAAKMNGYYYGRFDIKVSSEQDLIKGVNIRIMEFNGISAEPAHIYDQSYNLFRALSDIKKHWKMMYGICIYNINNGMKPIGFGQTVKRVYNHFRSKK